MKSLVFIGVWIIGVCLGAQSFDLKKEQLVLAENRKGYLARGLIKSVTEQKCRVYLIDYRREVWVPIGKIVPVDERAGVTTGDRVVSFISPRIGCWATVEEHKQRRYRVRYFGPRGEAAAWLERARLYVAKKISGKRGISVLAEDGRGAQSEVKLYHKMYAVIIGIDRYVHLDQAMQLKYAVSDAKGVEAILRERYGIDKIITLYNQEATKENIQKVLLGEMSKIGKDDAVVVFFAGHGYTEKSGIEPLGYLIPHDGTFASSEMYRNISMNQIKDDISRRIPAKHIFYIMDCCYSGILVTRGAEGKPKKSLKDMQENTKEVVRQVLTAGSDQEEVLDGGPFGHSVFTGRLIEELKKTPDFITAMELSVLIRDKVRQDARAKGHEQNPQYGRLFGLGDFVLVVDAERNLRRKLREEQQKRLSLKGEQSGVESNLRRIEEEMAATRRRLAEARSTVERIAAERNQKLLEARRWREQLKQAELAKKIEIHQRVEAEVQKQLEKELEAQKELERLAQVEARRAEEEKEREKRYATELERARIAAQNKLADMKKEAERKREELEQLYAKQLGLSQAKEEVKRLRNQLAGSNEKYRNDMARSLSELEQSYVPRYQSIRDHIAKYQPLLHKCEADIAQKWQELNAAIRQDKDMFESESEYRERLSREREDARQKAQQYAKEQREKVKIAHNMVEEGKRNLSRVQAEAASEKEQLRSAYEAQREKWAQFYQGHLERILNQIYRVKVDRLDLGKYNAEAQQFEGTFQCNGISNQAKYTHFILPLPGNVAREWYKGKQHLWAELPVKLQDDLSEAILGMEIKYLAADPIGKSSARAMVMSESEWQALMDKRRIAREEKERWQQATRSGDGRYLVSREGIIRDTKTGLDWYVGPERNTNWNEANTWVKNLTVAGGGWRLPTLDELEGIYETNKKYNLDKVFGSRNIYIFVWSNKTHGSSSAWDFPFRNGNRGWGNRGASNRARGFAVRSGSR